MPTMELTWHEDFIWRLASVVQPKVYVELGVLYGRNFNRMVNHAQQLIAVDINAAAGNNLIDSPKVTFFHGTTQDFAKELAANPIVIDMLFIDADHSKAAVLEDFHAFFPYISPHGLILLHDSHPDSPRMMHPGLCGTAYEAIEELGRDTREYELMTIPVSPGLTICRKRQHQLSWQEA